MSHDSETRVCVLTPSGRGAVAVVAVAGPQSVAATGRYFYAANTRPLADQTLGRIVYGHWNSDQVDKNTDGEDLVICRRTEHELEIHCHGGQQSSAQIVADLIAAGCAPVDPTQWLTQQHECPLTAAAHQALAQAPTQRTATILLDQYHGALRRELETIDTELENDPTSARKRIGQLLQYAPLGLHLTQPWQVVIAGEPNVGKSSLINALVGYERAIVFDQPGTTRDVVTSTTAIEGWPVQLSDTAGLHETPDAIEIAGITLARERVAAADLILWVLDASAIASDINLWQLAQQQALAVGVELDHQRTQLVINKIDLVQPPLQTTEQAILTCATSSQGIDTLLASIAKQLVPVDPSADAAIPFTTEQIAVLQAKLDILEKR